MTSLAFMLVEVPDPVWNTSTGNWSSWSPAATASAAAAMRSARSSSRSPSSALTAAAAALMRANQWMTATGTGSPDTGKFSTALAVSAPHRAPVGGSPVMSPTLPGGWWASAAGADPGEDAQRRCVREEGLEPSHPFGHRHLKPARLPIPPLARGGSTIVAGSAANDAPRLGPVAALGRGGRFVRRRDPGLRSGSGNVVGAPTRPASSDAAAMIAASMRSRSVVAYRSTASASPSATSRVANTVAVSGVGAQASTGQGGLVDPVADGEIDELLEERLAAQRPAVVVRSRRVTAIWSGSVSQSSASRMPSVAVGANEMRVMTVLASWRRRSRTSRIASPIERVAGLEVVDEHPVAGTGGLGERLERLVDPTLAHHDLDHRLEVALSCRHRRHGGRT